MGNPAPVSAAKKPRLTWVRKAADQVPTKWFATILAAVFLVITIPLGSLADAPASPAPPQLSSGIEIELQDLTLTFDDAFIADEWSDAMMYGREGMRALVVAVTVTNTTTGPISTAGVASGVFDQMLVATNLTPEERASLIVVARPERTTAPLLPPGLVMELYLAWDVRPELQSVDLEVHEVDYRAPVSIGSPLDTQWWREETVGVFSPVVADLGPGTADD